MTWKCPACGTNDNCSDLLRCSCGYEVSGEKHEGIQTIKNEPSEFPRHEDLKQCPECNSTNIEKINTYNRILSCPNCNSPKFTFYDRRKRGWYLILAAIILAPIFFYVIPGATLVSTGCILIVGSKGVHLVLKGGFYYICQDCLLCVDENGNKLGK
jgi:uncharacterized paraquat-inducible protein A